MPDGKVLIAGNISSIGNTPTKAVVRLNADATLDESFQSSIYLNESAQTTALFVDEDGKVLLGSNNYQFNGDDYLIRLNPDGSLDDTFSAGSNLQFINRIQQQPDGKYIVSAWTGGGR